MPDYKCYAPAPWSWQSDEIKEVRINNGMTNIGNYAFYMLPTLTSIAIPESVTSIGEFAFYGCSDLTSITIPKSVTSIREYAFRNSGLTSITIPESVTSIGDWAFYDCFDLTSITIPNSVTSVGYGILSDCFRLTSVTIGMKNIGDSFKFSLNSHRKTSVTLLDGVESLGQFAFYSCSSLNSITIPESVTSIGMEAFYKCTHLTSVTNLATTPQEIGPYTFSVYGTLHVLPGCKAAYEAAKYWKNFTIVEDATTNINVVENPAIYSSDKVFSVSGQLLDSPKKGVNIMKGRKILVK